MGRLIYSMSVSLDGFVETPSRSIDWVHIDEELHTFFNDEAREMSAFLYGRRMYELMTAYWPTAESDPSATSAEVDFARLWKDKPKVVFSRTLADVGWNSRLVRDGAVGEVARLKAQPGFDMGVGGPTLAATLIQAGLVDEYRLYVNPVILGGGRPFFPALEAREELRLVETRQFAGGVVFLRYETTRVEKRRRTPRVGVVRSVDGRSAAELTVEPIANDLLRSRPIAMIVPLGRSTDTAIRPPKGR